MSYENFVRVKVVTPVTSGATSFAIETAIAPQKLPPTDGGYLVLCDSPGNPSWIEVIQYTSRSGLGISGVTRGVEGTSAVAWSGNVYAFQALMAGEANLIQTTLAGKQAQIAAGTTSQYWRGDKTWVDFMTDVRAATLTGLSTSTNAVISATDSVLSGLGKLQKQISDAATNLAANVRAVALTGYVLGSNVSLAATDTVLAAFGKVQAQINAKANAADAALTGVPTAPTAALGTNTTQLANMAALQAAIANLINSAPGALDTLNELATALGNDPNFATTMTNALAGKEPTIVADTVNKFYAGTKVWRDLPTDVRAVVLTGLSVATGTAVVAGDTLLVALGKLQKQCTDRLLLSGGTMTGALNEAPIPSIAVAATVDIGAAAANTILVTGNGTITGFGSNATQGVRRNVFFSGAVVLTHSANLTLPGQINFTTQSGDFFEFTYQGAGIWYCSKVMCTDGQPVRTVSLAKGGTGSTTQAGAQTALGLTPATTATANTVVMRDAGGNAVMAFCFATTVYANQLEIGGTAGVASTPFLDFHSGATTVDYDTRILSDTPTGTLGGGTMRYYAGGGHFFTGLINSTVTINATGGCYNNGQLTWSRADFNPNTKLKGAVDGLPGNLGDYNKVYAPYYQNFTAAQQVYNGAIEIRENNQVGAGGAAPGHIYNAPGITFHWSAYAVSKLMMTNAGNMAWGDPNGAMGIFTPNGDISGSAWSGALSSWINIYCLTSSNFRTQFAGMRAGELGSYVLAAFSPVGSIVMNNGVVGSSLIACSSQGGNQGTTFAGNWYCAGHIASQLQNTLWQRYV